MLRLTKELVINEYQLTHIEFKHVPEHFVLSVSSGQVLSVPLFQCVPNAIRLLGFTELADQLEGNHD